MAFWFRSSELVNRDAETDLALASATEDRFAKPFQKGVRLACFATSMSQPIHFTTSTP
jgi:hypothetical protein